MYQPITPVIPFVPTFTTDLFVTYFLLDGTSVLSQSSRTTSIFPSAIALKLGWFSVMFSTLTLQLSFDSRTFLTTYTFAVEPTHEFSFRTTLPHDAAACCFPPAVAPALTTSAATANAATPAMPTRLRTRAFDIR